MQSSQNHMRTGRCSTIVGLDGTQLTTQWRLVTATNRAIYNTEIVQAKIDKTLRAWWRGTRKMLDLYERMLDTWENRYHVKPVGMPDIERLYTTLPNFEAVLDDICGDVSLALSADDATLRIPPILLLWPPGAGKTHFSKQVARLLWTWHWFISLWSTTAWWILTGSSSQWEWAKPWKIFDILVDGEYANPVIIADEIDKTSSDTRYDPLWWFYTLLEHDTAKDFVDEFAEVPIDASYVNWIATANDIHRIPKPLLDRMRIYEIPQPNQEQARIIANALYTEIRGENTWWKNFVESPSDEVLDILWNIWPRGMRQSLEKAFGKASLANRDHIVPADLQIKQTWKIGMWFMW